jgi:hypothetical protein
MGLGLGLNISKIKPSGGGEEPVELISHWIGDNESGGSIPNEVGGKPALSPVIVESIDWGVYKGWANNTGGQSPTLATGIINATVADFSMVMAHSVGSGYNATVNQRFISAKDSGDVERVDLWSFPKTDNTKCFESSVAGESVANLPIADIGTPGTNYIFTIIYQDPDIKIYRNGVLKGTLAGTWSQAALDGVFAFGQWYGGGTNGYLATSWAEAKIFAGVILDSQRTTEENALATKYSITF